MTKVVLPLAAATTRDSLSVYCLAVVIIILLGYYYVILNSGGTQSGNFGEMKRRWWFGGVFFSALVVSPFDDDDDDVFQFPPSLHSVRISTFSSWKLYFSSEKQVDDIPVHASSWERTELCFSETC